MAGDSSDSSDDCAVMLREAVDCSLFTNSMFEDKAADSKDTKKIVKVKSNRKVEETSFRRDDIEVTPSMQVYVAKKLSSLIDNQVQFVETVPESEVSVAEVDDEAGFGIRLFSNSVATVTKLTPDENQIPTPKKAPTKKSKPVPRLRDPSPDEATKIRQAAVNPSFILDQVEVAGWHKNEKRQSKNVDHYNLRNGNLFPVDLPNEFTKLCRKNNWDTKKIRQPIKRKLPADVE